MSGTILIVMWFAMSMSYMRETQYFPQMMTQEFSTPKACEDAAALIRSAYPNNKVTTVCVPKNK